MAPRGRGNLGTYLWSAFLRRWNLLAFVGAGAAALLSPWPDALLPLVAAGELTYLAGLVSRPKFRQAVDAAENRKLRSGGRGGSRHGEAASVSDLVAGLSVSGRERFAKLRARCIEMQRIARGAQGKAHGDTSGSEVGTAALDRLLWTFLRLLVAKQALDRFLDSTDPEALERHVEVARGRLQEAVDARDERMEASLRDSLAVAELRLENYRKAVGNAEFMGIELDRVEAKIQALVEMSVIRQDPDFLSSQVDAAAESMRQTESTLRELQTLTGLTDALESPPPILDLGRRTVGNEA